MSDTRSVTSLKLSPSVFLSTFQTAYEIRHVQECLRRGLVQSPLVTHAMTQDVLEMCDEIRRQWGLVYPFEQHRA